MQEEQPDYVSKSPDLPLRRFIADSEILGKTDYKKKN